MRHLLISRLLKMMLWVLAGVIFGIQGVAMLALIATPIVFGLILTVTLGR